MATGLSGRTRSVRGALVSLSLSMLLSSLGTSIANVALPTLAQSFGVTFPEVQWVVLAYLISSTTLIVSVGRLGDLAGRRRMLLAGLGLYTIASVACSIAPTLWWLVVARAVQGLGAAVMMALSMALVGETVEKAKIGQAMGLLGSLSAVGTALGPSLGGVLIAAFGWPALFLVSVPLAILTLLLSLRFLVPDGRTSKFTSAGLDPRGTMLLASSLAAYSLAMTMGRGEFDLLNLGLLITAAVGVGLFLANESRVPSPLVRLELFHHRALLGGFGMSALVSTVMMATLVVGPFYLSRSLGLNPGQVGLALSVGPLISALTGWPAGHYVDRLGTQRMIFVGLVSIAVGSGLLCLMPASLGLYGYLGAIVVVTGGYAVFQTANNASVMGGIAGDQRGVFSGMLNLSRNLGLITGASAMGAVFASAAGTIEITAAEPDAVAGGMRFTFGVATLLILAAIGMMTVSRTKDSKSVTTKSMAGGFGNGSPKG